MGRTAGRSGSQTKNLLLAAATTVIRARGLGVTLDDIAAAAGVSKGGLVYHFASKEILLTELAREQIDRFRVTIATKLDPDDDAPGRWTRAYVRAMLDPEQDTVAAWESTSLLCQLMVDPTVQVIAREAYESLTEQLRTDGLPEELSVFIVAAADGATAPMMWGAPLDHRRNLLLEQQLIHWTLHPHTWVTPSQEERTP